MSICETAASTLCGCTDDSGDTNHSDGNRDVAAPVVTSHAPSGALTSGTTTTTLSVVTDEPATCRYDVSDVPYESMRNDGVRQSSDAT